MSQISRKLSRRLLFQKLFILGFININDEDFLSSFYYDDWTLSVDLEYYREMQEIVLNKEYFFINLIEKYAPKFEITNMSLLYVLPVFIASAEIFYLKEEIPIKVSVNEAIELAKMFWDDPIKKIVNGILNNIMEDYDKLKDVTDNFSNKSEFSFFNR